jgi:hypothetical protein
MPIRWFGDRKAYQKSEIKIITVGLNPSDKEFREMDGDPFTSQLRFPDYEIGNGSSLEKALNSYFEKNPYRSWFNGGFEYILNGMDASYYSGKKNRALHTDICSPWATDPTWSKLSVLEQGILISTGFPEWEQLVKGLEPNIILFSVPQKYANMLKVGPLNELCRITTTKSGEQRSKPVVIQKGMYGRSLAVFGRTWNLPFGSLGKEQKIKLGKQIINLI